MHLGQHLVGLTLVTAATAYPLIRTDWQWFGDEKVKGGPMISDHTLELVRACLVRELQHKWLCTADPALVRVDMSVGK